MPFQNGSVFVATARADCTILSVNDITLEVCRCVMLISTACIWILSSAVALHCSAWVDTLNLYGHKVWLCRPHAGSMHWHKPRKHGRGEAMWYLPSSSAEAILESIPSLLPWYCYECGVQVTMPKATNECNIALKNMKSLFSIKTWMHSPPPVCSKSYWMVVAIHVDCLMSISGSNPFVSKVQIPVTF